MLAAAARLQAWFGLTHGDRCLSVSSPNGLHTAADGRQRCHPNEQCCRGAG
jgi:hypothetical protein